MLTYFYMPQDDLRNKDPYYSHMIVIPILHLTIDQYYTDNKNWLIKLRNKNCNNQIYLKMVCSHHHHLFLLIIDNI